jgi:hypothetical protein
MNPSECRSSIYIFIVNFLFIFWTTSALNEELRGYDLLELESGSILPSGHIALRNNTAYDLDFFLLRHSVWSRYTLRAAREVDIPDSESILAVSTSTSASDPAAEAAPSETSAPLATGNSPAPFKIVKPHFLRRIDDSQRWELCWSPTLSMWVVQHLHERLCD